MHKDNSLSVFVTGGAGFIGSHVVDSLLAGGCTVSVFDNFDPAYEPTLKRENLAEAQHQPGFLLIKGDIRDESALAEAITVASPRVIVHLAARAGVRPSLEDPAGYADVNVRGTIVVLETARKLGVRNVVFASSSSVYGSSADVPFRESACTDRPLSPYGATKKAGEAICYTYHHLYGMSVACLRFFTVYGPRQRPDLAIRKFAGRALTGEEIPIFGDGSSRRDYTHVRDILTGITGAMDWVASDAPRFGIFNLGSSHPILLRDMVTMIETAVGHPVKRTHLPAQPGDVPQTYADTTLAERELGFRHSVDFEKGVCEFVEWMRVRQK